MSVIKLLEYLYYLGYACATVDPSDDSAAESYRRLACKILTACEKFHGFVLLSSSEWEILQEAKALSGILIFSDSDLKKNRNECDKNGT